MTDQAREELKEIKAKLIENYEAKDKDVYIHEDARLHKILIELTGNKLVQELSERIYSLEHLSRTIALHSHGRFNDYHEEHLGIIDGLLEGNVEKALMYHERHLRIAQEESIKLLGMSARQAR